MTYKRVGEMSLYQFLLHPFNSHRKAAFAGALAVACGLLMSFSSAQAGPVFGDLRGYTRSDQGAPLPGVQVVVHNVSANTDQKVVSDEHGAYLLDNLKPGRYQVTALKQGMAVSEVTTVDLRPQEDLRIDVTLDPLKGTISNLTPDAHATAVNGNVGAGPLTDREMLLLARLDQLEQRLEAIEARDAKAAGMRATSAQPTPVASQPKTSAPTAVATVATPGNGGAPVTASPMIASLDGSAGVSPKQTAQDEAMNFPLTPTLAAPAAKPAGSTVAVTAPAAPTQEAAPDKKKKIDPFSDWDWTWLNGNPRTKDIYWDSKFFTPEIRSDVTATWQNHHPADHSMGGSSELFREGEVQLEQLALAATSTMTMFAHGL